MKLYMFSGRAKAGKDRSKDILVEHLTRMHEGACCGEDDKEASGRMYASDHVMARAFAEPLKKMVCILLGLTEQELADPEVKEMARPWLVNLGGDVRERDPNAWADNACRSIMDAMNRGVEHAIITDWRYFNEAYRVIEWFHKTYPPADTRNAALRSINGRNVLQHRSASPVQIYLVRVSAPREVRAERMGERHYKNYVESGIANDSSEKQLDILETANFKINPAQLADVQTLRAFTRIIPNDSTIEDFTVRLLMWFESVQRGEVQPAGAEAMRACYRLARNMGPEAALMIQPPEPEDLVVGG